MFADFFVGTVYCMTSSDANCLTAVALVLEFLGFDVNYKIAFCVILWGNCRH